jgi:predicted aminopeptidase
VKFGLKNLSRTRKWLAGVVLLVALLAVSGCQTLSFYSQAVRGQYQLFAHQHPMQKVICDPQTPARLKQQLELVERLRAFAKNELKLPVDGHYRKYVDVKRPYVVWNVEAAPEFSLEPKSWWYPLVGSQEYRGYFSEKHARAYAAQLRKEGFDAYMGGVTAYSTLGWFKDPILNTFVFDREPDLAETIFHELGHQKVFARGDTDFNEAFATTVGQEGARRWLRAKGDTATAEKYEAELRRTVQFAHLVMGTRERLEALYGDELTETGIAQATNKKQNVSREELRREKKRILDDLQSEYVKLKAQWGGETEYDNWFAKGVNNAKLNSVAAYYDFVPGFERLLTINGGDLQKFYHGASELAKLPRKERHAWLKNPDGTVFQAN